MPAPTAVRVAAYTAVLAASFVTNALWVPDGVHTARDGFRAGALGYDSDLVVNRLALADVPAAHPLYWHDYLKGGGGFVYTSQFGLSGVLLAPLYRVMGESVEAFAAAASVGCGLLTAGVLALFLGSIARRVGPAAADLAALLTAATPILLPFAPSLYWACALLFAPFVATWLLFPRCDGSPAGLAGLAALVAVFVGLKCLCGYEYVSTVVLAPAAAVVYHRAAAGWPLRSAVGPSLILATAGAAGFVAAVGVHVAQLAAVTGADGLAVLRGRATAHALGGLGDAAIGSACLAPNPTFLPDAVRVPVRCLLDYFWLPAVATPTTWGPASGFLSFGAVVALTVLLGWAVRRRRGLVAAGTTAFVPAAAVGFAAGASWHLLAVTHTSIHISYNLVTYAVAFLPLAYALFGAAFQRAVDRVPRLRFLPAVVLVATLCGNVVAWHGRQDAAGDADRRAEAAVAAVLRGEAATVPPPAYTVGPVVRLDRAPIHLGSEAWSLSCRVRRDFDAPGVPTRLVNGRVNGPPAGPGDAVVRVVAAAGGRVIPARVAYSRIVLVERLTKYRSSCVGFTVAVADADVPHGEPLRLFAVADSGFDVVSELTVPADAGP